MRSDPSGSPGHRQSGWFDSSRSDPGDTAQAGGPQLAQGEAGRPAGAGETRNETSVGPKRWLRGVGGEPGARPRGGGGLLLRTRVRVVMAVALTLLALSTIAAVTAGQRSEDARRNVENELQPAQAQVRALLASLVDQETGQRGYVIPGDDAFLEPYSRGRPESERRIPELGDHLAGDPTAQAQLGEVEDAISTWRSTAAQPELEARRTGGLEAARRLVAEGRARRRSTRSARRWRPCWSSSTGGSPPPGTTHRGPVETSSSPWWPAPRCCWPWRSRSPSWSGGGSCGRSTCSGTACARSPGATSTIVWRSSAPRRSPPSAPTRTRCGDAGVRAGHLSPGARGSPAADPVVAGMRKQLTSASPTDSQGVATAGELHPAEGVLAGDWWDVR